MIDFKQLCIGRRSFGCQIPEPAHNVKVTYDSRYYFYLIEPEDRDNFRSWVDQVFWQNKDNYDPELPEPYQIQFTDI